MTAIWNSISNPITSFLDRLTSRVTMYRLVVALLLALALIALAYAQFAPDQVSIEPKAMLLSLVVLLVATYGSNRLFALAFRVQPHSESSVITALLLYFLAVPTAEPVALAWLVVLAALASGSKYLLAFRHRHIFNPAAAGAALYGVLFSLIWPAFADRPSYSPIGWWLGTSESMAPYVIVAAFLVLFRTRKLAMGVLFVVLTAALVVYSLVDGGAPFGNSVYNSLFTYYPIIFLAGFMLSEPLTLPPLRRQQLAVAAIVAFFFAYPLLFGALEIGNVSLFGGQEWALLAGNLFAFCCGQRKGIELTFTGRTQLTPTTYEFEFASRRPLNHRPGQYMELTVPHRKADSRGIRRVFSLTSPPEEPGVARFGIKMAEKSSSFKTAFAELQPGDKVAATAVGGDFLLPADPQQPLLLIAGGIGITPYISQLAHLHGTDAQRDVVLVYAVNDPSEISYSEVLSRTGTRVVLVAPTAPGSLPSGWTFAEGRFLSADILREQVPDAMRRAAYVSGPPVMVNAISGALAGMGVAKVKTDRFSGY